MGQNRIQVRPGQVIAVQLLSVTDAFTISLHCLSAMSLYSLSPRLSIVFPHLITAALLASSTLMYF